MVLFCSKYSLNSWTQNHVYYALRKKTQFKFCPCPGTLVESDIKGSRLINLIEKILNQLVIQMWTLLGALIWSTVTIKSKLYC